MGRVVSTAFYSFSSPSLPPSFSARSQSKRDHHRVRRDPGGFILSIWIDFLDRRESHAVDDAIERYKERARREVVVSKEEKKEKNQKSPLFSSQNSKKSFLGERSSIFCLRKN